MSVTDEEKMQNENRCPNGYTIDDAGYCCGEKHDDLDKESSKIQELSAGQMKERDDIVKAIGQRCHALMRYEGKKPELVASALLWCAVSMYAQGAPDLSREGMQLLTGYTWDECKRFLAEIEAANAKKGEGDGEANQG